MVGTVKNDNGYIAGFVEWNLLNAQGQFGGEAEYIYIYNIWIHERERKSVVFQELINIIDEHPFAKNAKYVYWDYKRDGQGMKISDDARDDFRDLEQSRIYDRRHLADKILKREV